MNAILGKKIGMTQIFDQEGNLVGVTAIEAGPCVVLAVKEKSIQVGFQPVPEKKVKKPQLGYFKKLGLPPLKIIRELPRQPDKEYKVGDTIKVDIFQEGERLDISGVSIGKGFQGGMKRWNWSGGPKTHGSTSHRRIGSLGSTTTPGRVWKGHHLPGHMGNRKVTIQNIRLVKVDAENNLLLVEGAVPGCDNGLLVIKKAKKTRIPKQVQTSSKTTKKK